LAPSQFRLERPSAMTVPALRRGVHSAGKKDEEEGEVNWK
jgi:hypothetical protein